MSDTTDAIGEEDPWTTRLIGEETGETTTRSARKAAIPRTRGRRGPQHHHAPGEETLVSSTRHG